MERAIRILHLDDDLGDHELLALTLREAGPAIEWEWAASREDFRAFLERGGFDLILADRRIPGFDGEQAAALARRLRPEVPFIYFTGLGGRETEAIAAGAVACVPKDSPRRLLAAIALAVGSDRLNGYAAVPGYATVAD